jgi:hypothetical protein
LPVGQATASPPTLSKHQRQIFFLFSSKLWAQRRVKNSMMFYATTASSVAAFAPIVKPLVLCHHHVAATALYALELPTATAAAATCIAGMVLQGGATALATTQAGAAGVAVDCAAAAAPVILQMDRVRIRLDGLSSYGVICSLLMNAALRLYSATPKKLDKQQQQQQQWDASSSDTTASSSSSSGSKPLLFSYSGTDIIKMIFMVSTVISISAGSYTTVVFTLLGLYAKTALGLGRDGPFLEFFELTTPFRKLAFDAFVVSLVSFQISFVTSLYLSYDKKLRWWSSGLASVLALFCFWQWGMIIKIASRLLFS